MCFRTAMKDTSARNEDSVGLVCRVQRFGLRVCRLRISLEGFRILVALSRCPYVRRNHVTDYHCVRLLDA